MRMSLINILASLTVAAFAVASTPSFAAGGPVAVEVIVPNPPGATNELIVGGMKKSLPIYKKVPGLQRKYFTYNSNSFGGMYLFRDRASAEAWFTESWRAKAYATYGSPPVVNYYDVPFIINNGGR